MNRLTHLLLICGIFAALPAHAITSFTHVVVIVQENRTPDNLFYELCSQQNVTCTDTSTSSTAYDIKQTIG